MTNIYKIQTFLAKLGMSEKENKVYLTLLEIGSAPASLLATKAGVNRGTVYDILESLTRQGLVTCHEVKSSKIFAAESPSKLQGIILEKEDDLKELKTRLPEVIQDLSIKFSGSHDRPRLKLYEGKSGIRSILLDVLTSMKQSKNKVYYVYSAANLRKNVYTAMPKFTFLRIKSGIRVKTIALGEGGQLAGLDERKWMKLPQQELLTVYQFIYAGKVAHLSLDKAMQPIGVVVEDDAIYQTQKLIFEFNWSKL